MVCVTLCIPCQHGQHEDHITEWDKMPGRLGGFECPCEGGCAGNLPSHVQEIIDASPLSLPEGWPPGSATNQKEVRR